MRLSFVLIILTTLLLSGCGASRPVELIQVEHRYSLSELSEINIDMQAGQINLASGDLQEIVLAASLVDPNSLIEQKRDSVLYVSLTDSDEGEELTLQVPDGLMLKVDAFSADIHLIDLAGQIEISSVAGDINLNSFTGKVLLWAGRGDVEVLNGSGDIDAIGEHGILSVSGFNGDVSMTTIMGTIRYLSVEGANGSAALESDHGPIEVLLPDNVNYSVQVNTTSGYVTCLGAAFSQTVDGCTGVVGNGAGELAIRTVSGRVDLKVVPSQPEGQND